MIDIKLNAVVGVDVTHKSITVELVVFDEDVLETGWFVVEEADDNFEFFRPFKRESTRGPSYYIRRSPGKNSFFQFYYLKCGI